MIQLYKPTRYYLKNVGSYSWPAIRRILKCLLSIKIILGFFREPIGYLKGCRRNRHSLAVCLHTETNMSKLSNKLSHPPLLLISYPGSAFFKFGKGLLSETPDTICNSNGFCLEAYNTLIQLDTWLQAPLEKMGSLLQNFAEPVIKGSFHPSMFFHENRLIMLQREDELSM